jgi:hypothetical protein
MELVQSAVQRPPPPHLFRESVVSLTDGSIEGVFSSLPTAALERPMGGPLREGAK